MSEELHIHFRVKGLIAPIEGLKYNKIWIKGLEGNEALISLIEHTEKDSQAETLAKLKTELDNIAEIYGIVTNRYFKILDTSFEILRDGNVKVVGAELIAKHVINNESRVKNVPQIEKALKKHDELHGIFSQKEKFFLRNAIDYYTRSLKDYRLEEKLLDLMIALESLFSSEKDELGYRYSLRASSLLSICQEAKRKAVYDNTHYLYNQRSIVVHGVKKIDLDYKSIVFLQQNVREAIKRMVHMDMPKQKILELLDASIIDKDSAILLNEKVTEAINKW
jgi:hypothetical protein